MEFTHPEALIQARSLTLRRNRKVDALKKIFSSDPAVSAQLLLLIPVFAAGIVFNLSVLQWFLVVPVTLLAAVCGIFRAAALLQVKRDAKMTPFHASRVRMMGNAIVTLSGGISLLVYLLVFIPAILQSV